MPDRTFDAIIVGELNIDLVLWKAPMPEWEREKLAQDMHFVMGSSSAITAHNFSVIGGRAGFIGKVGRDIFGDFVMTELARAGVATVGIIRDPSLKTGASVVLADPPKKAVLTYMGAMTGLTFDDIDWDFIAQARHLHMGCFFLQPGIRKDVARLFARAREMGLTTSLDTNWDPEDRWGEDLMRALEVTDIFFPNEDEALRIARTSTVEAAMEKLREKVRIVAVKRGQAGAAALVEGKAYAHPGFTVKAVETTGAGDSFNAGFLHRFLQGAGWEECLRWGNACGAIAVTAMGGTGAFQDRGSVIQQLERLLHNE